MLDFTKVFDEIVEDVRLCAQKKYGSNSWEDSFEDVPRLTNYDSMWHHLADARCGVTEDHESGLHPLEHLIYRAAIEYVRAKQEQRGEGNE